MENKPVALVTGAGSGIGRASAVSLASRGWDIVLVGRTEASLAVTAQGIPTQARIAVCDVADPRATRDVVEALRNESTSLQALVNCAAVTVPATLADITSDTAEALWRTNVVGPMMLTQACLPLLAATHEHPSPVVVNITTSVGQRGWPGSGVYAATKTALESLTRTWAIELAPRGIRVVAIAPGAVETPMAASTGASPDQVTALRQWQRDHTPLGRVADAAEVAQAVEFICSSATFVTGAVIPVDGGAVIA